MVDFNSEGAFTANKAHILELVILGRRDELINTFQLWAEAKIANSSKEEGLRNKLRAVLLSVFLELERPLSRKLSVRKGKDDGYKVDSSKFDKIKKQIVSFDEDLDHKDLMDIYFILNKALDEMNLIKIDNKRAYDSTSIETENEQKGL